MKNPFGMGSVIISVLGLAVLMGTPTAEAATAISGTIKDVSAQNVANATVYLIPSADVMEMAKGKMEIMKNAKNDEPLEDNLVHCIF